MKRNRSIKQKLLRTTMIVIVVTILFSAVTKAVSDVLVRNKSDEILIEQAMGSAEVFVEGQTDSVNEQLKSLSEKLEQAASYTEYIYLHPDQFAKRHAKTPWEFDDNDPAAKEVTFHWSAFTDEDEKKQEVLDEADLLTALESEFYSIYDSSPIIQSVYIGTMTHINIGYDTNVLAKKAGRFDPIAANKKWLLEPVETGKSCISDVYIDEYGRGLTISISSPFKVDGKVRGAFGADIRIQQIIDNILNIDMTGISGYATLFKADGTLIAMKNMTENSTAKDILGTNYEQALSMFSSEKSGRIETEIGSSDMVCVFNTVESTGWKLAVILSSDDILAPTEEINSTTLTFSLISLAISIVLLVVMLIIVGRFCNTFTQPIIQLTEDVAKIGDGNFDYKSNIETGDELQFLSESFENMTTSLKDYIKNLTEVTAEKERIGADLAIATEIQSSMLPCIFPPFPDNKDFTIFATMTPAKEVGGDFYDFFMVDEKHIAIVVADVSGKGVPAALFMVIGKTLIKDHTVTGCDLGKVFTEVNDLLCEANSKGLFITAFEGVIDLETGEMTYVNAGHETPFICHKGGKFEPHKVEAKFVLAGFEGMRYKAGKLQLEKGDKVFQYTDGVTEATNADNKLYGMDRLERFLAAKSEKSPEELLPAVKADIDKFVGEAPQFDDITMLCIEYKPNIEE